MSGGVHFEIEQEIGTLTLDDGKANAISFDLIAEINALVDRIESERSARALVGFPTLPLSTPATIGVTPLALSMASLISLICKSSLGASVSPPNSSIEASGLSVYHILPGETGLSSKPSIPLPKYILNDWNVILLARSLRRVLSSSCSGINGSTSLTPS